MKALIFLALTLGMQTAFADYTATVFEQNSGRQKKLYTFQFKSTEKDGKEDIHVLHKDLEGNVVAEEKAKVEGSKLQRYEIDHKQIEQQGLIEVKDGKVFFTKTVGGKTSTNEEKLQDTLVANANFQKFIKDNWDQIKDGKEIAFRYAVWDRQETVGFEIFKTGTDKIGEKEVLVLKMKPSSFIIAALVKPIIFKFEADGSKLLEMNGRVVPKRKDGSTYKDLDGEVVYTY